ncbi:MAG: class I SAM-dependent methyltransferase [Acidihalobacter sp.]|jgi:predicted O-methyltransferase YrrM
MTRRTLSLTDELYEYLLENSLREDSLLAELRERTAAMPLAGMQIAPEQGQFMALLARLMGAHTALEIGVFTGYSSLCVARALPDGGRMVALDASEEWTDVARDYWARAGLADRIELRLGPAIESLDALLAEGRSGSFDFAFIDADKSEYPEYYERTLQLLRSGGIMLIDNVLRDGQVADPDDISEGTEAVRAFNAVLYSDTRIDLSMLPLGDGLTLARKR